MVNSAGLAQVQQEKPGLPQLNTIRTATLSPAYSCRPAGGDPGYVNTALFLSEYEKKVNSPDLLFNGTCQGDNYFEAALAGDDFSLVADLGENVALGEVSANKAFNFKRVHSFTEYSKFADAVKVVASHTYAVLLNNRDKRGLFVFTVDEYVPGQKVVIRYAVLSYQIGGVWQARADGFEWERKNR
ncbi:MAG: hypothetical protein JO314_10600 [Acidobacteria bacterium]|nr:hypothetical protein [Acidobacteriota bacterium]